MITYKILPAHIIRLYVWELLQQEIGMEKANGLVPILPVEDEPKVADANVPYAIYGFSESEAGNMHVIRNGIFSLRVVAGTLVKLGEIINTVSLGFESPDITTEALNHFANNYQNGLLQGIRFTSVKTGYIEGGEASESEGGEVDGVINISYEYINNMETPVVGDFNGLWS